MKSLDIIKSYIGDCMRKTWTNTDIAIFMAALKAAFIREPRAPFGQTDKAEFCKAALAQIKVVYILD